MPSEALMSHWRGLPRQASEPLPQETIMHGKFNVFAAAPTLMQEFRRASIELASAANFDPKLTELVKIRASQLNGCANCINMHASEAREKGETEQRIYLLSAWREAPCYSARERAALEWTEALTRLSEGPALGSVYESLAAQFTEEERVKLTITINMINGWNRLAVGFSLFADAAQLRAGNQAAA
jgi:AhpD family alkylhydroperoxidase